MPSSPSPSCMSVLIMSVTFLVIISAGLALSSSAAAEVVNESSPVKSQAETLRWFFRKMGKRASSTIEKCPENAACAMLQLQPGSTSYWTEEICSCGDGVPMCSMEWQEENLDGKSLTNSDTQLKLCHPISTKPTCAAEQIAVTSTMETSMAHPLIKQAASIFCNCPKATHEFKLADAGMVDEGDRTVVSAHFGCVTVEHCRPLQPCKFLAILPTGDSLVHQNCACPRKEECPRDASPDGVSPVMMDDITYYPFFCH